MNKISLVLLTLLFSASIASAESFDVKAINYGIDLQSQQRTKVEAITKTYTDAKDPTFTTPRVNKDVRGNEIDTTSIGANANHSVVVDPDCIACGDKFYDDTKVIVDNYGDVFATTDTLSTVGVVGDNTINNTAIGSSAGGSYANDLERQTLTNTTPAGTATFFVISQNHGRDAAGNRTQVIAVASTYTSYERLGAGTAAETDYEGADVDANVIDNRAYGSNASMDVVVNVDLEADGKFYTDVDLASLNFGDVMAQANTYSDVGHVNDNFISNTAIGANASGSYSQFAHRPQFSNHSGGGRDRALTLERQLLTTDHGYMIPNEIKILGIEKDFKDCMNKTKETFDKIRTKYPEQGQYVVNFAFNYPYFMKFNLREACHLIELRTVPQGHVDYRQVAQQMFKEINKVHPSLSKIIKFVDLKEYDLERFESEKRTEEKRKKLK